MDTTPEKAAQAVALLEAGHSQREVSRRLNMSRSTVQRVNQRYQESGDFVRRPGSGRSRFTSERDDRYIAVTSLRNRGLNAVEVQQQLREVRGVDVSRWTVRRRLREKNLTPHRAATGPKLTPAHRRLRLQFARKHAEWTLELWGSVLFSDESRICIHGNDGRRRVYRRPGERFAQCCIEERVGYGGGSCMVWGGISLEARTDLVFIDRAGRGAGRAGLTGQRYVNDILAEHVMPYAGFIGDNFLLMHDNARPHTAAIVRDYLADIGVRAMDWPARSPDLNPIEHMWDELKKRIRARVPTVSSIQELKDALIEEWNNISQDFVVQLVASLTNRMNEVIRARGGNTRY